MVVGGWQEEGIRTDGEPRVGWTVTGVVVGREKVMRGVGRRETVVREGGKEEMAVRGGEEWRTVVRREGKRETGLRG